MITTLIVNLQLVGAMFIFVILSFLANTFLGIAKSSTINHDFDIKKLKNGLLKGLLIIISVFSLTIVISLFFPILDYFGIILIEESLMNSINILTIVGPIITTTTIYIKDACAKIKELFVKDNEIQIKFNEYVD